MRYIDSKWRSFAPVKDIDSEFFAYYFLLSQLYEGIYPKKIELVLFTIFCFELKFYEKNAFCENLHNL